MPKDLTAIVFTAGLRSDEEIRALAARFGNQWLRIAPLAPLCLTQLEVLDGVRGLPAEDPELVSELSKKGRAAFVHVNHSAPQALVHGFADGKADEGWVGVPGEELDDKLRQAIGHTLEELHAADDGSRIGIGVAASRTVALSRGRGLTVPAGTPTGLNSFAFHDRGFEVGEGTRMAPFAFDEAQARAAFGAPARELAARLSTSVKGPLEGARPEVIDALAKLGDHALGADDDCALRAFELCAWDTAYAFGGGDRQYYWDHRVLPMFHLSEGTPQLDQEELDELDQCDSILEAIVDVVPWAAPPGGEGSIFSNLGPSELVPLAPWAEGQEEYTGTIFRLRFERLLQAMRRLDGPSLDRRIADFERAWYQAARGVLPQGDPWETWRRIKAEEGEKDMQRFLVDCTELRIVLELAAANQLAVGMLFYE